MRAYPLAGWVWEGSRLPNKCKSGGIAGFRRRDILASSILARHGERGLGCLRKPAGAICLVALAGKAFAVQLGFLHQIERVRDKPKLVLRDG